MRLDAATHYLFFFYTIAHACSTAVANWAGSNQFFGGGGTFTLSTKRNRLSYEARRPGRLRAGVFFLAFPLASE